MAAPGSSGGGGVSSSSGRPTNGAAAINAAATAVGSADARFHSQPPQQHRRSRWSGCLSGLSCFGSQKGGKRIVPAARIPDGNASTSRGNALQPGGNSNQNAALNLSLLAPPSSPASFSNSALPSTAQSPNCFLSISANSPGGPTSNMFATGPYAHEPQLVSPPVFSTYTTEPSTAPLTPPPELAHATTPSSPDVPYARFLSSSADLKSAGKEHNMPFLSTTYSAGSGLQASYPLYPESPCSSLISPASATPRTGLSSPIPEQEVPTARWKTSRSARDSPYSRNPPSNIFGHDSVAAKNFMLDGSFFRPAASAQFYLDQAQQSFPYNGGRLSVSRDSRESDIYASGGNRHNANCKQDVEETEAYRASFGFSADEIITTQHYIEIPDALDESFTILPFGNGNVCTEQGSFELPNESQKMEKSLFDVKDTTSTKKAADQLANGSPHKLLHCNILTGPKSGSQSEETDIARDGHPFRRTMDQISLKPIDVKKKVHPGQSCSDAEIEYRRAKSLRETHGILAWRSTLP